MKEVREDDVEVRWRISLEWKDISSIFDIGINWRAKIIFEHYCPKNGTIYDYSAGYGGRILGALCS